MPEGLSSWPAVIEHMLWMRYCDEALVNCDNYGGDITFDLVISGEKKEKKRLQLKREEDKEFRVHYEVFRKSLCTQRIQ